MTEIEGPLPSPRRGCAWLPGKIPGLGQEVISQHCHPLAV